MAKYTDYGTLSSRYVEEIAYSRSLEEARRSYGFPANLPEDATLSAAFAEIIAGYGQPQFVNVMSFGAKGDGVTDDTPAFNAAMAQLSITSGGVIVCPNPSVAYAVNLVVAGRSNIQLLGTSGIDTVTTNRFVPFNPALPVITIGQSSPTAFNYGIRLEKICLFATGPNGIGTVGLKIMAGMHRCSYRDVAINGFTTYGLRIESGVDATFGSASRHYFDGLHVQCSGTHNRALVSIDYNFGGAGALQYVTAVFFKNLSLNGSVWGVTGRTATSGNVSALTDSGQNWAINEWAGMAVTIVSGTGIGQTRDIASNTSNSLVPTVNFGVAPDNTSRYEIVGYALENDGSEAGFTDSYFDVSSWRSVRLKQDGATLPFILCNNLSIDGANSTDIVVQVPYGATGLSVSNYAIGLVNIDGYVLLNDGTTFHPSGRQYSYNNSQLTNPVIYGAINFGGTDLGDASSLNTMGPGSTHSGGFFLNTEGTLNLKPGTALCQLIAPTTTATFSLVETTGGFVGTLRCVSGLVQLYSGASKNLELIAGGSGSASKLRIDFNCGPVMPAYAKASLPTVIAGALIYVSDWPQGKRIATYDGSSWRPVNNDQQAGKGDADVTLQYDTDVAVQRFTTNLTANRTVTLSTAGTTPRGARFYIKRDAGGAFNLDIGPGLKTLTTTGQYAQFCFDSVSWYLEFSA